MSYILCPKCDSELDTFYHSSIFQNLIICPKSKCFYFDIIYQILEILRYENLDTDTLSRLEKMWVDGNHDTKETFDTHIQVLKTVFNKSKNKFSTQFYYIYSMLNKVYDYYSSDLASDHFLTLLSHYFADQHIKKLEFYNQENVLVDISKKPKEKINNDTPTVENQFFIFDVDNTLRYEFDNTNIHHMMDKYENIAISSFATNDTGGFPVFLASCNNYKSVADWAKLNGIYQDNIFAPLCKTGIKDFMPIMQNIKNNYAPSDANIYIVGDSEKDYLGFLSLKQDLRHNNTIFPDKKINIYFIRPLVYGKKYIVNKQFKEEGDYFVPKDPDKYFFNFDISDLHHLPDAIFHPEFVNVSQLYLDSAYSRYYFYQSNSMYIDAWFGVTNYEISSLKSSNTKDNFENQFRVVILGRYFRKSIQDNNDTSTMLSIDILKFKDTGIMPDILQQKLLSYFLTLINNSIKRKTNILITTVPNSDGNYRFRNFLNILEQNINDMRSSNVKVIPDYFQQKTSKNPQHFQSDVEARKNNVSGIYSINTKYAHLEGFKIYVLDDVITSGSTMHELHRLVTQTKNVFYGVAMAQTQSRPYKDFFSYVNNQYVPINIPPHDRYRGDWDDKSIYFGWD